MSAIRKPFRPLTIISRLGKVSRAWHMGIAGLGGVILVQTAMAQMSFVDLGGYGEAEAASGAQQVGSVLEHALLWSGSTTSAAGAYAALWSGTSSSFVNLNPGGATGSALQGISGSQQVVWASLGTLHAGVWSGTAASFYGPAGDTGFQLHEFVCAGFIRR
jgi:hypothetical protein